MSRRTHWVQDLGHQAQAMLSRRRAISERTKVRRKNGTHRSFASSRQEKRGNGR